MENTINLLSISELLERSFFIPSYQRGYRWTKQQVEDMMNDIYTFAIKKNKTEKEFYCLQPVVVKPHRWERPSNNGSMVAIEGWELVDGQQRLTTIRILLSYLIKEHLRGETLKKEYGKDVFSIDYETREKTEQFLADIEEDNTENIDFFHISSASKYIREWFERQDGQRDVREAILRTLVYDEEKKKVEGIVKIIWYQINDGKNPIDTFIRINLGKIPLNNAELIKALFLQKRNFGGNSTPEYRQLEIASEWDRMEYSLQNDDFWWFLNKAENPVPTRIELLFELLAKIATEKDKELEGRIGTDNYSTFRFFNEKFAKANSQSDLENEWESVKNLFLALEEWFNDPVWFHYVGFLIFSGTSILNIHQLYQNKTKDQFSGILKAEIKNYFSKIKFTKSIFSQIHGSDATVSQLTSYGIDLQYNKHRIKIRHLLLLLNLETIVLQYKRTKQEADAEIYMKFPFKLFKKEKWDVEHIDSFNANNIENADTQMEWLKTALIDIGGQLDGELLAKIGTFIKSEGKSSVFHDLRNEISEKVGEAVNDEKVKNGIGNLTLLDASTNRGYGNSLFPTKRRVIIEKDNQGQFIPICTKNVFLKFFDKQGTSRTQWAANDIEVYQNFIGATLEEFLTFKTN